MASDDLDVIAAAAKGTAEGLTQSLQAIVLDLLGGAAKELGAELTLTVQEWRMRRAVGLGRLVHARLQGLPRRPIAPRVLLPAFEYAVLEDREELISLWVALLANAGTDGAGEVERIYVEILKDLTPLDARLLQWARAFPPELDGNDPRTMEGSSFLGPAPEAVRPRVTRLTAMQALGISGDDFELAAARLQRLGLCEAGRLIFPTRMGASATGPRVYDAIALSPLGIAFLDACTSSQREAEGRLPVE